MCIIICICIHEVIMFVCAYRYHTLSVASSSALRTNTGKKIVVSKHHVQAYASSRHTSHCWWQTFRSNILWTWMWWIKKFTLCYPILFVNKLDKYKRKNRCKSLQNCNASTSISGIYRNVYDSVTHYLYWAGASPVETAHCIVSCGPWKWFTK